MPTVIEFEENIEKLVSKNFDPKTFFADFLTAVGAPSALLRQMEGQGTLFGDAPLLWRKKLHFLLAPMGRVQQCVNYLELHPDTKKHKPRILLSTDGEDVMARDTKSGELLTCAYRKLSDNFGFFLPLADIERYKIADENPVDVKATGRLAKFYDEILRDNSSWKTEEKRHALNHFITQIIFCLFAEDTGIFPEKGMFTQTISTYCESDSKAATEVIKNLFTAMATEGAKREGLPAYASRFPHVNGGLFRGTPDIPHFTKGSVRYLLDAGQLEWQYINPDIFGSMIQGIVNEKMRAEMGMHYTSVPNILKVLEPMFLDSLREQVSDGWNKPKALHSVLERLGKIRVFDPACGSGNFLVIAYRELREIEISVISRLKELENYSAPLRSYVKLENFVGIEYIDFAAETARLALWIAEHQMTTRYAAEFGQQPPALPLRDAGVIVHGNALRVIWEEICPQTGDDSIETYIVGNPPYLGYNKQSADQKEDLRLIFANVVKNWKSLDYISGWFYKASLYLRGKDCAAFVSTSSICQGEHVPILWPSIFATSSTIFFVHSSFKWQNNASDNAGVTCVIIGLTKFPRARRIFDGDKITKCANINAYLLDAPNFIILPRNKPNPQLGRMVLGNMAKDGGHLLISSDEYEAIKNDDSITRFVRPFIGSQELIDGIRRYCLWIGDNEVEEALKVPFIVERLARVTKMRLESPSLDTQEYAETPHRFKQIQGVGLSSSIIIPRHSSENRPYLPVGLVLGQCVVGDSAFAFYDVPIWNFGIVASRLNLVWVSLTSGKLESRYRYSSTMSWNTLPVPDLSESNMRDIKATTEAIMVAREEFFDKTISELYDPVGFSESFPKLCKAHLENDKVIEEIYNDGRTFKNDAERLKHLFSRYIEANKDKE